MDEVFSRERPRDRVSQCRLASGAGRLLSAVIGVSPAFVHLFDELIARNVFLAIAGAPDRFQPNRARSELGGAEDARGVSYTSSVARAGAFSDRHSLRP